MWVWNPKMEQFLFGLSLLLTLGDGVFRFVSVSRSVCNQGVAFGLTVPEPFLWLFLWSLLMASAWQGWKSTDRTTQLAWWTIFLGGGVNGVDRFFHGCVSDYLTVPLFPSFNLADMMLFLGVMYLLCRMTGIFSTGKTYVS